VSESLDRLRTHARAVWDSAVAAVRPQLLVRAALTDRELPLGAALYRARRILVVGAGKAAAAMSAGVEETLADSLDRVEGIVNIPAPSPSATSSLPQPARIRLHVARPAGTNQPTSEGVAGARQILDLVSHAGPDDVCLCLISGGGSALLPAPAEGLTLEDKQAVTLLLHACGATINEMNCVRKHLSAVKGGRLAQAFTGRALFSLIISDVIGDPLDVIASGPTAADPTTFADALAVLHKYHLEARAPAAVRRHLERGAAGELPETLKALPANVHNCIIGNNARALAAAQARARELGYPVLNLGSFLEGETRHVAVALAGIVRSIRADRLPLAPPCCLLAGGETTVTLAKDHGQGGRNQEFVLAAAAKLGEEGLADTVILSGGTDGEDGPTDAAGAVADARTLRRAAERGLSPPAFLERNDAYHFFAATGDLLRTGLTQTNVMDVRVILVGAH
jgi:hydroxypyruvate reductase/glycerate 2-kinase